MTGNSLSGVWKKQDPPQIFSGWKDVANYLGKGVRTVQRYEKELALPVRRPGGKTRGSVVATRAEIDAWIAASPVRDTFEPGTRRGTNSLPSMGSLRTSLGEMRKLREQMVALRSEMVHSVVLLSESLRQMCKRTGQLTAQSIPMTNDNPHPVYGLLGDPVRPPKIVETALRRSQTSAVSGAA
jgi:predicted DNA-binding transcriptional regulator AlpA